MIMKRLKFPGLWLISLLCLQCCCSFTRADDYHDMLEELGPEVGGEVDSDDNAIEEHNIKATENRLAAQIFAVIEHYKQEDPLGFPGAPIPDPMDVPDMKKSLGMATLTMMKVKTHGLSKFRIARINADLQALKVEAGIELDQMLVKGSYILVSFFSKANGPFTVDLKKVYIKAIATLGVERDGRLTTEKIKMDITFGDMAMDFQNLGFLGTVFQGIVNSAPNLVFDAMKPYMLQEADKQLRHEINTNIDKMMGERLLPNSISPLDMAIAEGRRKVREEGLDPYKIPDIKRETDSENSMFDVRMTNTWIHGISSFYRVGDMVVGMENNTVSIRLQLGTQQITGAGQWEVSCGFLTRVGHVQFTVQHVKVTVAISQALDTRKRPQINDLQIDLGNIQVRCDGAGTLDYIMEFVVNILPNLLRYQIMNALENPIKVRIQEVFNKIDVEKAIRDNAHKFENFDPKNISFDFKI